MTRSPYELSTSPEGLAGLHPRLRAYFGPIPPGHVGRGEGVFAVVGTPRRWLWPVLAWFARDAVMFPVWERDVPFTVENRPSHTAGRVAVRAQRTFRFRTGDRTMVDAITAEPEGLVDHLGHHGRVSALLRIEVTDGALRLVSTRLWFRALGRGWRLPTALSPRVTLVERFDDEADRQRVSLVLTAPVIGTLYRYEGAFRYGIVPETGPEGDR
ncbi:DUF4166 domain-containing protein [Curtobacterium sp. ISL-83]|uniref:DUF4166 domain-containing protein n=1 Tax=Curtobacterium sp. ISL-83 TaxID=2819145 RepID=UPI001BE6DD3B|nr:DUF4166 domain-containing protein [Curtobacterium sp. ISL-83]MBT2502544.1 DUF4166 domain-containing protein [Curtobacterium sp. ISL-83]